MKPRVLGTCYICGKKLYGYRVIAVGDVNRHKGKEVVRDVNGVRHGRCSFVRTATGITPSDA